MLGPQAQADVAATSAHEAKEPVPSQIGCGTVLGRRCANGAGKSNLLEALGVVGAAAFGSVEPETLRYRGVRPGLPSLYKSSFRGKALRRIITMEASSPNASYRVGLDNPITSPSPKWRIA